MTWQAASMLLLAGALVGGALWYERSRPQPQVIALVAAMAALAAAGRVVFSPVPNVVPTTDLAVFSGYALGGAPGFMVGALSALVSNLWLGQGPWTPWQMAGWGLAGLFGAGLAVVTGRRMGRMGFAVACAAMGLIYGALLDYSAMVVFGGEQSLERYLALSVRGIPFNLAHAAGNFAIALVAGPAIVRLLERHRRRFTHRWDGSATRGASAILLIALACVGIGSAVRSDPARAGDPRPFSGIHAVRSADAQSAFEWLRRVQNADGGFGFSPGRASDPATTGWVSLALAAAGRNPKSIASRQGSSAIDYLRERADSIRTTGDLERTVLALAASGLPTNEFGGVRLMKRLRERVEDDGSLNGQVNLTAFYLLATAAASGEPDRRSLSWIKRAQTGGGGWGYAVGVTPDADSTGAALQALSAFDAGRGAVRRGATWLRRNQSRSGGWGLPGASANSQSTAWAVQGLVAAGRLPRAVKSGGRSPLDFLASRQSRDGHFRYSSVSDQTSVWVTAQALVAVEGKPFPIAAVGGSSKEASSQAGGANPRPSPDGSSGDRGESTSAGGSSEGSVRDQSALEDRSTGSDDGSTGGEDQPESEGLRSWWWLTLVGGLFLVGLVWLGVRIRRTLRS